MNLLISLCALSAVMLGVNGLGNIHAILNAYRDINMDPSPEPTSKPSESPTGIPRNDGDRQGISTSVIIQNYLLVLNGDFHSLESNLIALDVTVQEWARLVILSALNVDEYPMLKPIIIYIHNVSAPHIQIDYALSAQDIPTARLAIHNINSAESVHGFNIITNDLISIYPDIDLTADYHPTWAPTWDPTTHPTLSPTYDLSHSDCSIGSECTQTEECCADGVYERPRGITCSTKYKHSDFWWTRTTHDQGCCVKMGFGCVDDVQCCGAKSICHDSICTQPQWIADIKFASIGDVEIIDDGLEASSGRTDTMENWEESIMVLVVSIVLILICVSICICRCRVNHESKESTSPIMDEYDMDTDIDVIGGNARDEQRQSFID